MFTLASEVCLDAAAAAEPALVKGAESLAGRLLGAAPEVSTLTRAVGESKAVADLPALDLTTVNTEALTSPRADVVRKLLPEGYGLAGKMVRGTHGAWLVTDETGANSIFKIVSRGDTTVQIKQSAESATLVDSAIGRTPKYSAVGYSQEGGSWYIQEFLPGKPAPTPSPKLLEQMMLMNGRQAGVGLADASNWSNKVMDALYKDSKGWLKRVGSSGEQGRALVNRVQSIVDNNRSLVLNSGDVVHGDFQHFNALVGDGDKLTGYIDWEQAGKGDRGIDLARMLYDAHVAQDEIGYTVNPESLRFLNSHIAQVSGKAARDNFMSYWVLQVADFGLWGGPEKSRMFMNVGNRILDGLAEPKPLALAQKLRAA